MVLNVKERLDWDEPIQIKFFVPAYTELVNSGLPEDSQVGANE